MHRICGSLSGAGYAVTLVGRELATSIPMQAMPFAQKRLRCFFNKGFAFYAEYNLRLFFFLLTKDADAICAIDLDTILPCLFVSKLKGCKRVYDAHEYFTELKEVRTRPVVQKFWTAVESFAVPKFNNGYTVSEGLAEAFATKYACHYAVIRNLTRLLPLTDDVERLPVLFYGGAVNEARGFEYLIPAMRQVPYKLIICGDGNFMPQLKKLIADNNVADKVELRGMTSPQELRLAAQAATLGIALAEREGINQFHALPNKFLDYMHAGLPQVAMDFPEYRRINEHHRVAILIDDLSPDAIAAALNSIMQNDAALEEMHRNAIIAREIYCWQAEEQRLLHFYHQLFI